MRHVVTSAQHVVHAVTGTVTRAAHVVASTVAHAYHAVTTGLQNIAAIARKDAGQVFHVIREGATRVVHAVGDAVRQSVGAVARTATSVGHWFKKHNQIIGKIGKVLSNVSGALALAGLAIAPIPGLDFLTPVLEGAAAASALGGLAADGVAKAAGDRNITYGDLLTAAVGVIPGGGDVEDAAEGLNVASYAAEDSVALDSGAARALSSADRSVANRLTAQIAGRKMIMSQTAADEFQGAVARLAGPAEKDLAENLMNEVQIVADNPSARAAALRITNKVGANDIQIFGTADQLGIPIFTSDFKFLRGAAAQGVEFDAIVHPPMSFLGY